MARSLTDARTVADGSERSPRATAADDGATWRVAPRTVAVFATALAGLLTTFHLGHKSLWLDEGYSVGHARMPWAPFWQVLTEREPNGALHALVLFPWIRVSDAEWWLRLPSAMAATATVPVLYLLLRRLFDDRVAATGALLLAVNAFQLQFAQEARAYALVMFVGTLSTLLFVAFVQDGRRGQWWAWVGVSVLLPYAHLFGWLVLGVQGAMALLRRGDLARPTRRLMAGFATIAVLGGTVLALIATGEEEGQAEGIPGFSVVRFVGVYARVAGNGGILLLGAFVTLGAFTTVTYVRQLWPLRPFRPTERQWGFLYLAAWLILPPIAIALLSPVQPLFGARYFVILVPAAAGLTALGIQTVPAGWMRRAAAAVVGVLVVGAAIAWYVRPPADDIRGAAQTISADVQPGDGVVFLPWFVELPFDEYALRDPSLERALDPVWPVATWGSFLPDHRDHPEADEIAATVAAHDRVWLVIRDDRSPADDRDLAAYVDELSRDHRETDRIDLHGVDVVLFERG